MDDCNNVPNHSTGKISLDQRSTKLAYNTWIQVNRVCWPVSTNSIPIQIVSEQYFWLFYLISVALQLSHSTLRVMPIASTANDEWLPRTTHNCKCTNIIHDICQHCRRASTSTSSTSTSSTSWKTPSSTERPRPHWQRTPSTRRWLSSVSFTLSACLLWHNSQL